MDIADMFGHISLMALMSSYWSIEYHSTFSIPFQEASAAAIICFSGHPDNFFLPTILLEQIVAALLRVHYEDRAGAIDQKRQHQGAVAVRSTSKRSDRNAARPGVGFAFRRTRSLSVDLSLRVDSGLPVADTTEAILLIAEEDVPVAKLEKRAVSDPSPRKQNAEGLLMTWPGIRGCDGKDDSPRRSDSRNEPVSPDDLAQMFEDSSPV